MHFNEIKKTTGKFRLPEWESSKYIKINYNIKKEITHIHPSPPANWHLDIQGYERGETCHFEYDLNSSWILTEENMASSQWIKVYE
jgi:hypothetical protein